MPLISFANTVRTLTTPIPTAATATSAQVSNVSSAFVITNLDAMYVLTVTAAAPLPPPVTAPIMWILAAASPSDRTRIYYGIPLSTGAGAVAFAGAPVWRGNLYAVTTGAPTIWQQAGSNIQLSFGSSLVWPAVAAAVTPQIYVAIGSNTSNNVMVLPGITAPYTMAVQYSAPGPSTGRAFNGNYTTATLPVAPANLTGADPASNSETVAATFTGLVSQQATPTADIVVNRIQAGRVWIVDQITFETIPVVSPFPTINTYLNGRIIAPSVNTVGATIKGLPFYRINSMDELKFSFSSIPSTLVNGTIVASLFYNEYSIMDIPFFRDTV